MIIGSISENIKYEKRVAITPDVIKKYQSLGLEVHLSENYASHLGIHDKQYEDEGANILSQDDVLSNSDAKFLRKELLETCNLHTILNLPRKVFTAGVKTVVLFFEKGNATKKIFYYDLNLDRNLGLTNPLTKNDLVDFENLYNQRMN